MDLYAFHLFINHTDLNNISSRLLLRNVNYSVTTRKNSVKARIECARIDPVEQPWCQQTPISHRVSFLGYNLKMLQMK